MRWIILSWPAMVWLECPSLGEGVFEEQGRLLPTCSLTAARLRSWHSSSSLCSRSCSACFFFFSYSAFWRCSSCNSADRSGAQAFPSVSLSLGFRLHCTMFRAFSLYNTSFTFIFISSPKKQEVFEVFVKSKALLTEISNAMLFCLILNHLNELGCITIFLSSLQSVVHKPLT